MRPVYVISGGVSKFAKARPDKTFQAIIKEAYDYTLADIGIDFPTFTRLVDGSVASYFSDHFTRQLMAGIMAQDYLGLCPKPGHRVEGGGATGGLCFKEAWKSVASGHMDICLAYGFETMCTQPLMKRFNIPATSRASFAMYNTKEGVDVLVNGLKKIIEVFG